MEELEHIDLDAIRVIECRYFTGLTIEETAEALQMSASTVKRKWQFGKAWLARKIKPGGMF
ncbi:MAG: ECF-type sigma factor, partial [bacterium]